MRTLAPASACAASALLYGFLHHHAAWPLIWVTLVPLFWACAPASAGRALLLGWLFGAAAFAAGSPWLVSTMTQFFSMPLPLAFSFFVLYCALLGFQFALCTGGARWLADGLRRHFGLGADAAFAAASVPLWVVIEWLYPEQFPKCLALTQVPHLPQIQSLELFGPSVLAWLIVGVNAALFVFLRDRRRWQPLALAAALVLANEAYGRARLAQVDAMVARSLAESGALKVGVPQGAQTIDERGKGGTAELYSDLSSAALKSGPLDLIVWPESAFAGREVDCVGGPWGLSAPTMDGKPLAKALSRLMPQKADVLFNAVAVVPTNGELRTFNASFLTGPDRAFLGAALKRRLIPFGEYVPLAGAFPPLRRLSPRASAMTPGWNAGVLHMSDGTRLGVMICYEDLFASYSAELSVKGSDLLVHQGTDVWFAGLPEFHLNVGRLRAVENRKFLLRSTESGVSAMIDPAGRVTARLDFGARGHLEAAAARMPGATLYARAGDVLALLALLAVAFLAGLAT